MNQRRTDRFRPILSESPHAWLWFVGAARILALSVTAAGAYRLCTHRELQLLLMSLYGLALLTGCLYLGSVKRSKHVPALLTWTQMLVDFGVVAATVAVTEGIRSLFTFMMVIVILEAGLLLGLSQGFVFATLASGFMAIQAAQPSPPIPATPTEWIEIWYRFLIQGLGFYLTAFVSGHWNQRVTQMEQFQRRILDNMSNGFLITDAKGTVTAMNRSACQVLKMADGTAVGLPVQEVLRAASGGECPILTALRSKRNFNSYEFQAVIGPNDMKLLGLTTSLIYDARRHPTGVIASFTDLTEMARMRQEIQSQDRLAAVGELAAGLAHEVRNPVAAIRGAVDELQSSIHSPEIVAKLANIAIRESDHLNQIVAGFLAFARNPRLQREVFDLRDLTREVRGLLTHDRAVPPNLRIVVGMPDSPCLVSGDRSQIKQVFMNLGRNGVEAMREGGTLTISIVPGSGSFETRFEDEGPGIPPDKITKIFEPFYTEKERGVGMGLAICLRIVTSHDGTIRVGSREGGGATMTVRLPAASAEDSDEVAPVAEEARMAIEHERE